MTKNVFIDCGTNNGGGFRHFKDRYKFDSTWDVYLIEPNPYLRETIKKDIIESKENKGIKFFFEEKAVCKIGSPEEIDIHLEKTDGDQLPTAEGSTILESSLLKEDSLKNFVTCKVKTLDLCKLIYKIASPYPETLTDGTVRFDRKKINIVLKLDIEGAEYEVIYDLLRTNIASAVTDLHVEFHGWRFKDENAKIQEEVYLTGMLFQKRVNLFNHY